MEATVSTLLAKLLQAIPSAAINAQTAMDTALLAQKFQDLFKGYDSLSLEDKKEILRQSLLLGAELRKRIAAAVHVPNRHEQARAERMQDLRQAIVKLSGEATSIRGVGPRIADLLARKGVRTIEDVFYFLPRRYDDRRIVQKILQARVGVKETVVGKVVQAQVRPYQRRRAFEVLVDDGSGMLTAKWFMGNLTYLKNTFKPGSKVILTGEVRLFQAGKDMIHPDYEILDEDDADLLHFRRIVPVYSETEGLHQKTMRRVAMRVLNDYTRYVTSPIPEAICEKRRLIHIHDALRNVHFPEADADVALYNDLRSTAHRRLIYDEFFFFQLGLALKRKGHLLDQGIAFRTGGPLLQQFYKALPFSLTGAQARVIGEIEDDMARQTVMHRLLQGDVGSGKTVVAMAAMVTACENGYQAAMMAPTELLAQQHYATIKGWAERLNLKSILLTGSGRTGERNEIREDMASGRADIIIGTHALIQDSVSYGNLGLVVIDEQHRFGVLQRATLRTKGMAPDVLVMTATPIPRTLAMTVYGDLDVSVIDELPPQKKPIKTKVFYESQRAQVYEAIRKELAKKHQIFIVYPLVTESEVLDLKDATRMAQHLQQDIFPDHRVGLIHGRLKAHEKDEIMAAFLEKQTDILVSTTVIEVGIDIPQASVMVIEHAERFGLSQLHQLRGRVGRGDIPAYCILLAQHKGSQEARKRLRIMEETNDGFRIAEEDLAIRGPGEFMGVRQSGLPDFRVANIARDGHILSEAKTDAFALIEQDPSLSKHDHALLREVLLHRWQERLDLAKTG
ncbi:MAG: DNA helicase RecG [Syntrophus sp. (in: bacteria)]|nr:DNA helicase RecG [Syntrophus sp. (in: bacteria)]